MRDCGAALCRNRFGDFVIEASAGNTVLTGNRLPIAPDRIINAGLVITPADAIYSPWQKSRCIRPAMHPA